MTLEELKTDLTKKCPDCYFVDTVLKKDEKVFNRRTFGDLFNHYKQKGVTEKMLLKALIETGFTSYLCPDIIQFVFFRFPTKSYRFWIKDRNTYSHSVLVTQKYDFKYLNKLYDSIFKE